MRFANCWPEIEAVLKATNDVIEEGIAVDFEVFDTMKTLKNKLRWM
jgi:hypothetical protein